VSALDLPFVTNPTPIRQERSGCYLESQPLILSTHGYNKQERDLRWPEKPAPLGANVTASRTQGKDARHNTSN